MKSLKECFNGGILVVVCVVGASVLCDAIDIFYDLYTLAINM